MVNGRDNIVSTPSSIFDALSLDFVPISPHLLLFSSLTNVVNLGRHWACPGFDVGIIGIIFGTISHYTFEGTGYFTVLSCNIVDGVFGLRGA